MSKEKSEHINFKVPTRPTWAELNISRERLRELQSGCRAGRYSYNMLCKAAHTANKDIAEYILLSVTKKLSYEGLQILWELKEIERMPCGRTDFYALRRLFFYNLDCLVRTE